ncbi:MAG: PAS domain S-box protein [Acidobacteriia bacterium]|nr:PAS domain S-box protein [Terriglobia bacterium]
MAQWPSQRGDTDPALLCAAVAACRESMAIVEMGRLLYANDAFARMFGYHQAGEVQGRALAEFVPLDRACTRLDAGGDSQPESCGYPACEFGGTRKDGIGIWLQASCARFQAKDRNFLIITAHDISQRERRRIVRESDKRFRAIFNSAAIGMVQCTADGRVVESNPALERMLGYSKAELRGMHFRDFTHPDDVSADLDLFTETVAGKRDFYQMELRYLGKNSICGWVRLTVSLVRGPDANPEYVIGMVEDITERKRAEQQLRESQKMEVIGRLVGGVAHDFNNLLTGIMLYCDLMLAALNGKSRLRHHAEEIRLAGEHGAALIQQLLAVARQQVVEPRLLSINEAIEEMRNLLARLIGENIELHTELSNEMWLVKMDPAQVQQIILNLVLNARDAMPDGGRVTLRTRNRALPEAEADEGKAGWVEFIVTDNGCGMDAETRSHLFEPFFTTKRPGEGNGLGLATVHSIVRQGGGTIEVESEPGRGTRVIVRLPGAREKLGAPLEGGQSFSAQKGQETVLLVEDNSAVRKAGRRILTQRGYTVLEAANGAEALRICRDHADQIDLLLADLVMPGMNGREVARQIRLLRPDTRVLYTSGYHHTADTAGDHEPVLLFRKPFTGSALLKKVREVLDKPKDSNHQER